MSFMTVTEIVADIKAKHNTIKQVLFVGCGASMSDLYPAYYFIQHETKNLQTSIMTANEFNYNAPKNVDDKTIIITASLGGTTPETVEATKNARKLGASTISLSGTDDSPILKATEYPILHGFKETYAAKTEKPALALKLAIEIVNEYEDKSSDATFKEQQKIDKKYLNKFIKALLND